MTAKTQFEFDNDLKDPIDGEVHAHLWGQNWFALKQTGEAWLATNLSIDLDDDVDAQLTEYGYTDL